MSVLKFKRTQTFTVHHQTATDQLKHPHSPAAADTLRQETCGSCGLLLGFIEIILLQQFLETLLKPKPSQPEKMLLSKANKLKRALYIGHHIEHEV